MSDPNLINPATGQDPSMRVEGIRGFTAPFETHITEEWKYYYSPVETNQFHRADGKKIAFLFNFHQSNIKEDQDYLDKEIKDGNPYVRKATDEEVHYAHMRMNPKETMKKDILKDPDVQQKINDEVERKLKELLANGTVISDADKIAGTTNGVRTDIGDGATLTIISDASKNFASSIVNSADLSKAAAGSTSTNGNSGASAGLASLIK